MSPEDLTDRVRLDAVIQRRGRTVCVDVANLFGKNLRIAEGGLHAEHGAAALRLHIGKTIGVAGGAVAEQLRIDADTPSESVIEILKHQNSGSLGQHKAVAG